MDRALLNRLTLSGILDRIRAGMAATERVLILKPRIESSREKRDSTEVVGLRVRVRTTTASLSDYPEWNLEELRPQDRDRLVTDGACS